MFDEREQYLETRSVNVQCIKQHCTDVCRLFMSIFLSKV